MKGDKIPLIKATELYQPVKGTSADSKYFAIAIGDSLKMAARVKKSGDISLRVEGETDTYKDNLSSAGFSMSSSEHWSLHLKVEGTDMIRKTIGALLFAVNVPFNQVIGNVDKLIGAGI